MQKIVKVQIRSSHTGELVMVNQLVDLSTKAQTKALDAIRERNEDLVNAEAATEARAIRQHRALAADRQKLAF